jgi:hypothetical protein
MRIRDIVCAILRILLLQAALMVGAAVCSDLIHYWAPPRPVQPKVVRFDPQFHRPFYMDPPMRNRPVLAGR